MEKKDLSRIRLWLFDMDGTLYLGERLFDFTKPLLAAIRRGGGRYLFLTNNSSKSVADYVRKMERLGVAAEEADFLTPARRRRRGICTYTTRACRFTSAGPLRCSKSCGTKAFPS